MNMEVVMHTTRSSEPQIPGDLAGIAEYLAEAVSAGTTSAADAAAALSEWIPLDAVEEPDLPESATRLLALATNPRRDAAIGQLTTVGGRL
jgi:hypothetical protein